MTHFSKEPAGETPRFYVSFGFERECSAPDGAAASLGSWF